MPKKKKLTDNPSGIVPFAKQSGITSFSSLWSIKHALNTEKVGHTGTLDSFADGLLVVLSGSLTHLVPHITGFKKTYLAIVCFGTETDTLDPCGIITRKYSTESGQGIKIPDRGSVESACSKFTGAILQVPPVFSAIHVNGQRASDMVRNGCSVTIEPRQIFIYSNTLLDFKEPTAEDGNAYALLQIECSKGTYIRALARDMAEWLGSCAHLSALRRTQVGPFVLSEAACASFLPEFTIENGILNDRKFSSGKNSNEKIKDSDDKLQDIKKHFLVFTPELANRCGLKADYIKREYEKSYLNGRPLLGKMFSRIDFPEADAQSDEISVFYEDGRFAGMIRLVDRRLSYSFVVPVKESSGFRVFTWKQILENQFPVEWLSKGSAIAVGSFDGIHAGHEALLESVLSKKAYVPGAVTFRNSVRSGSKGFEGEISLLEQRLGLMSRKGLAFAVVIDFSDDFSRIEGSSFLEVLCNNCNMKCLVEGKDFRCGYKGAFDMNAIRNFAQEHSFSLEQVEDVIVDSQRVSSSRIRDAIVKGDFASVQKMLLRPFSYDAESLAWKESQEGWFVSERISNQILPADGTYSVVAVLDGEGDGFNVLHTVCTLDKNRIKLQLPSLHTAERVKCINFNH
ncbi:MAG: tRNA pseudouridine(55) synthase TruB [Treponema sp.]|nr:tRNA pseudouridine(55) synthase TruB [Treponema sp.]